MDKALKQRLVGATVLIALAVIVLPMLLGGRPDGTGSEPQKIELPQQPTELNFETRRYPIGDTDKKAASTPEMRALEESPNRPAPKIPSTTAVSGDSSPPVEQGTPGTTVTGLGPTPGVSDSPDIGETVPEPALDVATQEVPVEDAPPDSQPDPHPKPVPVTSSAGRYIVQVASFGAADNANRLSAQLKDAGYSVMTDTIKSDVGTLHRVRVGPFSSEATAKQTVLALSSSIDGVNPRVMDLRPEQAAQVTSPDDPLVRWVVQVGSFTDAANAENLVASLRLKGMSAYQETVSSSDSQLFRVRVGPFLSREDAVKTERQINESLPVSAVVMTTN